ncbi:MAG TPA: glycerol-3-phosphate acyltransferase [Candidatus Borkfalkia excrementavium]|uniref:Glycerol-3-phosphate acyltransferase n=1 Tax=Candidatus Borkfalkia excrementavium TaxID=2838505 RepID=A0A9D2CGR3_9FIRM|nr:glycerol-3-phosphate acyltransferase [Candidatus Borkfalkia excrementavium]
MLYFSEIWYWFVIMAIVSYFIGCFNFAMLISRIKHKDVRKMGSGNPGTMNMSRQFGLKIGALTLFLDMIKAGVPLMIAYFIFRGKVFAGTDVLVSDLARYVCGVSVIIGHIYPVTMRFRGGKGIASTLGMYSFALCCETEYPWMIGLVLGILVLTLFYIWASEWGSMGSLLGVSLLAIAQAVVFYFRYRAELANAFVIALFMLLLFDCFLTWFAHRKNIVALLSGEEHHTSVKKLSHGKKDAQ